MDLDLLVQGTTRGFIESFLKAYIDPPVEIG